MSYSEFMRAVLVLWLCGLNGSLAAQPLPRAHVDDFSGYPRVMVISDIGNEPDDQMSLVRLLLYSKEMEIEGLIASTSTWQSTRAGRVPTHGDACRARSHERPE